MAFDPSPKVQDLQQRLAAFMDEHIYPNEQRHVEQAETLGPWKVHPVIDELKPKARTALRELVEAFARWQGKADKCFLCNGAPKCVEACPAAALRYVPWSDRTREATTRGSFSLMVPDDRRAACNACHVESPGGPRNLKYEQ